MEFLKKEYIFLDENISTKDELFKFISKKANELNYFTQENELVDCFYKREGEASTGFEDGFAIPHAKVANLREPAIFVVRSKNGIEWETIDGQKVKVAIALIVPSESGQKHLEVLSGVAKKLMNDSFKSMLKKAKDANDVIKAFDEKKELKEKITVQTNNKKLNILAITACTVGVAHTYLAEEKLLKEGEKQGHNVRVETHGSKGIGTPFTQKEIESADLIIFAVDANVDKSRFQNLKQYEVKVSKAITNPEQVINDAIAKGVKPSADSKSNDSGIQINLGQKHESIMKHLLAGVSYMIPVVVLGGICLAFSLGIAKAIWGPSSDATDNGKHPYGILATISNIGSVAFSLMIVILGGFIANSIGGRAAIAPAMVASFIGNNTGLGSKEGFLVPWTFIKDLSEIQTPMGFVGAIIAGICAGYLVRWINTWRVPRALQAAMPIFFIPLFVGIILSLGFIYILGAPIGWIMNKVQIGIEHAYGITSITKNADGSVIANVNKNLSIGTGIALGIVIGAMAGFDMGGPINKIAFITCSLLVAASADPSLNQDAKDILQRPMGSMACAVPVAPLGMGFTTIFFKKFFDKESKNLGVGAIIMGCIGISEGAIPFAVRDPKRVFACNVLGSAVAGGIGGALGVQDAAAHGGPIVGILGAVPYGTQTLYLFLAIICGVIVTTTIYGFWLLSDAGKPGSVKEAHVKHLMSLHDIYVSNKEDLKSELKNLKLQIKTNNRNKELVENVDQINSKLQSRIEEINLELAKIKEKYITDRNKAKDAYNSLKKNEALRFKQERPHYTMEVKDIKNDYKETKEKLMQESKQTSDKKMRLVVKDQKESAKDNYYQRLFDASAKIRRDFVNEYNQKIKN